MKLLDLYYIPQTSCKMEETLTITNLFTHFGLNRNEFTKLFKMVNNEQLNNSTFFAGGSVIASYLADKIESSQDLDMYIHVDSYPCIEEHMENYLNQHNYEKFIKKNIDETGYYANCLTFHSKDKDKVIKEMCDYNCYTKTYGIEKFLIDNIANIIDNIENYSNVIYKNYYHDIICYRNKKTKKQIQVVLIKTDPKTLLESFDLSVCRMPLMLDSECKLYYGEEMLYDYEIDELHKRVFYLYNGICMANVTERVLKYVNRNFTFVDYITKKPMRNFDVICRTNLRNKQCNECSPTLCEHDFSRQMEKMRAVREEYQAHYERS